mgnify:CR=1 FL=1
MMSAHIEHMTLSVRAAKDSMLMTRAGNIRLACFDVDGTLTDGRLFFDSEGREIKAFHVHDGQGLVLLREANAVTDNPLVFAEDDAMISGGNFHAEPVALAADAMACAIAEVGAIAERRIAMLIDSSVSRLPPFLTPNAGLNSGFMIAHVTAASLASENKSLAHPASVDSLPTSANQEDHVSMATFAARRLQPMIANVAHILGIELLASAQGIDFLRPLQSSAVLEQVHALLRAQCPAMMQDRYLAPDIEAASALVRRGDLARILRTLPDLPALWITV